MPTAGEGANYGVDINTGGIADSFANFVWEPAVVKVCIMMLCFLSPLYSSLFSNLTWVIIMNANCRSML